MPYEYTIKFANNTGENEEVGVKTKVIIFPKKDYDENATFPIILEPEQCKVIDISTNYSTISFIVVPFDSHGTGKERKIKYEAELSCTDPKIDNCTFPDHKPKKFYWDFKIKYKKDEDSSESRAQTPVTVTDTQ